MRAFRKNKKQIQEEKARVIANIVKESFEKLRTEEGKWQEQHATQYLSTDLTNILGEKLAELEDKIENGTLVELPCKVGDVLYYVNKYETTPRIEENKVHTIEIYECMDGLTIRIWTQNGTFYADKMPNVFLTKAEAEAKLRELKEKENDND